ncbi:tripartite tricarboxylate transporter TctB family protein [Enterovirga sp.]|uniref:tripartite tricarboxylate transporter TctB family protein n=1 Tax=Enterovirga sp. TaxID=2026350 RepID=UPI002625689A|nr:tripartite tricarboxylate transporter TctB family protein [Enterovirga sp.]MDB5590628.1 tripartite tricarboxylate transporter TctB [Enterovirga sp.]
MAVDAERSGTPGGFVRGPQSLVSGLVLIALAALALWLTRDLPQGTLRAMGPAMLPRWLAIAVGLCGIALVVAGLVRDGHQLEGYSLRGASVVVTAILLFGVAIRGFDFQAFKVPTLGLMIAGPLAIFVSGFATPEVRARELLILALSLTGLCMLLFGDLLNLPIPMYPQAFADLYPAGWSSDGRLRMTAAVFLGLAVLIYLAGRRTASREPIDVVPDEHAGTV